MYVRTCVRTYVRAYVRTYVCMYVCIYLSLYIYIYRERCIRICIYIYIKRERERERDYLCYVFLLPRLLHALQFRTRSGALLRRAGRQKPHPGRNRLGSTLFGSGLFEKESVRFGSVRFGSEIVFFPVRRVSACVFRTTRSSVRFGSVRFAWFGSVSDSFLTITVSDTLLLECCFVLFLVV